MVVPLAARSVAGVAGLLLVLTTWFSVIVTLIVSRSVASWTTELADRAVVIAFNLLARNIDDYHRRDRVLTMLPAAMLLAHLALWLGTAFAGYALLLWPLTDHGVGSDFIASGSALFTLGFDEPAGAAPAAVVFAAAATGLIIVTLLIAYLPTLYAAFNRRETEVALLNARAGIPSWGPELLARTHYALGSGTSTLNTMPDLYAQWERWARRRGGKPHHLPNAGAVPLARRAVVMGDIPARRAGLRRAVPGALAGIRAGGAGPPVPAQRIHLLQPHRGGDGPRGT